MNRSTVSRSAATRLGDSLRGSAACLLLALLLATTLLLVARRLGGALQEPLPPLALSACGLVAATGAWVVSLVVSPLEPLKYVGRISPRPLFVLSGSGDDRMPLDASRLLHEAAGEPKTIRWIDTGHVHIRDREFHAKVKGELVEWLVANDFARGAYTDQP